MKGKDVMQTVIVTGMSGSGKSSAINCFEDMGYYCVDNLPPELLLTFSDICVKAGDKIKNVAVGVDVRSGEMFSELADIVSKLKEKGIGVKILYLDSSDEVLLKRYKETRRKHPLIDECFGNLKKALAAERELLLSVRGISDYYVDTSDLSIAKQKEKIHSMFLDDSFETLHISIMSYGFKFGSENEADLVFDVRCLPNPYYISELKEKTGLDREVSDYVMSFQDAQTLFSKLKDLIAFLLPLYIKEGKSQLVIAFGCTGGKHRSVTFAEKMSQYLSELGYHVNTEHRDINKH